jgi:hypothetical protein
MSTLYFFFVVVFGVAKAAQRSKTPTSTGRSSTSSTGRTDPRIQTKDEPGSSPHGVLRVVLFGGLVHDEQRLGSLPHHPPRSRQKVLAGKHERDEAVVVTVIVIVVVVFEDRAAVFFVAFAVVSLKAPPCQGAVVIHVIVRRGRRRRHLSGRLHRVVEPHAVVVDIPAIAVVNCKVCLLFVIFIFLNVSFVVFVIAHERFKLLLQQLLLFLHLHLVQEREARPPVGPRHSFQ